MREPLQVDHHSKDSTGLSACIWICVLTVLSLAGTACGQSAPDAEGESAPSVSLEPRDVAPIDFNFETTSDSSDQCVKQRTGLDPSYRDRAVGELSDEDLVPLYFSVILACLIREGDEVPEPIRSSLLDNNNILQALAYCLVSEHSWVESDDILDGVGGAIAPDVDAADKMRVLTECGFDDPESLDDDPFAKG